MSSSQPVKYVIDSRLKGMFYIVAKRSFDGRIISQFQHNSGWMLELIKGVEVPDHIPEASSGEALFIQAHICLAFYQVYGPSIVVSDFIDITPGMFRDLTKEHDIDAEEFHAEPRILHRVVRAMHDGHCPACGHLGSSDEFLVLDNQVGAVDRHECPSCNFYIPVGVSTEALKLFGVTMRKNLDHFVTWMNGLDDKKKFTERNLEPDSEGRI